MVAVSAVIPALLRRLPAPVGRLVGRILPAPTLMSSAVVETDAAERYAKQLASHLGRKARVEDGPEGRRIHVGTGSCLLVVGREALTLLAEAPDVAALKVVRDVVGGHLERFGRRGELVVRWSEPTTV